MAIRSPGVITISRIGTKTSKEGNEHIPSLEWGNPRERWAFFKGACLRAANVRRREAKNSKSRPLLIKAGTIFTKQGHFCQKLHLFLLFGNSEGGVEGALLIYLRS